MTAPRAQQIFRDLHARGCFLIPNPWDIGSARVLEQLGFKALATTSSGFAWSMGRRDNALTLEQAVEHFRTIASSVTIPVNGDFEGGFADEPEKLAVNVRKATATGIAGLSIEDSAGDPARPLYPFELAVDRVRAASRAISESGSGVLLTGRSEGFIVGRPDLPETIRRLTAYAEAGAECLYAPGIRTREEISAVVAALAPKPINVLAGSDFATVAALADMGVRRISVGGALARTAWTGFLRAAQEMRDSGTFKELGRAVAFAEINDRFA